MDKWTQIGKLAQAAMLIQSVLSECNPEVADDLQDMADHLANIADQIEELE